MHTTPIHVGDDSVEELNRVGQTRYSMARSVCARGSRETTNVLCVSQRSFLSILRKRKHAYLQSQAVGLERWLSG